MSNNSFPSRVYHYRKYLGSEYNPEDNIMNIIRSRAPVYDKGRDGQRPEANCGQEGRGESERIIQANEMISGPKTLSGRFSGISGRNEFNQTETKEKIRHA